MYRLSDSDFSVYFDYERLPKEAQQQAALSAKKVWLVFTDDFDLPKHPICEGIEVNHPKGTVVAKTGAATCQLQLDLCGAAHLENCRNESRRTVLQSTGELPEAGL